MGDEIQAQSHDERQTQVERLQDERRMTRVETILEAHETILLRIEAKMDTKFVGREEYESTIESLQHQIDDIKASRRYGVQTWAYWVSAGAAVAAWASTLWPKG